MAVEVEEEPQGDEVGSALVEEVVAVAVEDSHEVAAVDSHQEAVEVREVDFPVEEVKNVVLCWLCKFFGVKVASLRRCQGLL